MNFPDVLLIADSYQVSVPPPFVPGSEFAGVIDEVGDGDSGFAVGDRVTGTGMFGAFAERGRGAHAGLARDPRRRRRPHGGRVRRRAPHGVSHAAFDGAPGGGDELVVLGAGGGVGLAAVQLGVALGAKVTAVASSTEKLDVAASYGAKHR